MTFKNGHFAKFTNFGPLGCAHISQTKLRNTVCQPKKRLSGPRNGLSYVGGSKKGFLSFVSQTAERRETKIRIS